MIQLQVTIIRQTFQYMDMTCSLPQYGIPYVYMCYEEFQTSEIRHSKCKRHGILYNHHQADISVHGHDMFSAYFSVSQVVKLMRGSAAGRE
jgi:hypothetical protein